MASEGAMPDLRLSTLAQIAIGLGRRLRIEFVDE
jgi:hypothetical protein